MTFDYRIKAIPTTYANVTFRSRLEARWAAFFDLSGWAWDYEPFDTEGWAPDFMLKGAKKALVEIKPVDFRGGDKQLYMQAAACAEKAFRTAAAATGFRETNMEVLTDEELTRYVNEPVVQPPYEILILGNGPFQTVGPKKWAIGVFALEDWGNGCDVADIFESNKKTGALEYAARWGSYQYRISGEYSGDHHLRPVNDDAPLDLWRKAGSVVQWKAA